MGDAIRLEDRNRALSRPRSEDLGKPHHRVAGPARVLLNNVAPQTAGVVNPDGVPEKNSDARYHDSKIP
jgi:hypothetical protein